MALTQTQAQKDLAIIEAALAESAGASEESIGDRKVTWDVPALLAEQQRLRLVVAQEQGRIRRNIRGYFRNA